VEEYIDVRGFSAVIRYDEMGNWKRDKVVLYQHPDQTIGDREARSVIQYLYDEGFIVDRRVDYEILND
jgi:hypothetical protein